MNDAAAVLNLILSLSMELQKASQLVAQLHSEGRTKLTPEEWNSIKENRADAMAELDAAIARAGAEGR